jgi:hypothetical protein
MELTGAVEGMIDLIGGGTDVEITPIVTSGTKIADVSVGGVEKDLYCPAPTEVTVSQVQQSGTKIAIIGVNGVNTDLYAPEGGSGGSVNFSTSEIKVGTYTENGIDYDLYEKTYNITLSGAVTQISLADLNIKDTISINGKIYNNSDEIIMPFYENSTYNGRTKYNKGNKMLQIILSNDSFSYYPNASYNIFYTKNS